MESAQQKSRWENNCLQVSEGFPRGKGGRLGWIPPVKRPQSRITKKNILLQDKNLLLTQSSNNVKYHLGTQWRHAEVERDGHLYRISSPSSIRLFMPLFLSRVSWMPGIALGNGTTTVNKTSSYSPEPYVKLELWVEAGCYATAAFSCHFSHSDFFRILWFHRYAIKWGRRKQSTCFCPACSLPPAW